MEGLKQDFQKIMGEMIDEFKVEIDKCVNDNEIHFDSKAMM